MAKHPFLSAEWIEEARRLRQEHLGDSPAIATSIRMNQIVTEMPFGEAELRTYIDTSAGFLDMEIGELESPDVTVSLDYLTAKALFVDMNPQAGMEAFLSGRIKVTGDMTKLLALQSVMAPTGSADAAGNLIKEITE